MRHWLILAALFAAPSVMASNCSTQPDNQDLQNAPAQEMQAPQSTKSNSSCISATEFSARPKAKTSSRAAAGGSTANKPAASAQPSGTYVPKTKDDNTPYRFDMNQNGKRMTAEEFDAWMKAKGIHVATGKPGGPAVAQPTAPSEPECKPTKRKKCK
jgi:hypothetical protein